MKPPQGKIYLVGAGPGDPGLLTVRGAEVISTADAIVLDELVNPEILRPNPAARLIYVGKRGPGAPSGAFRRFSQGAINRILISLARKGLRVVRLKGGDPFVFGRGSEELEALRKAGARFEVIPGVTSATAVPAYAGIPATHRLWASQVTFITGREGDAQKSRAASVDWDHLSKNGTLIVLMGVSEWPNIQKKLLKAGWPSKKPVALIESGTLPGQRVFLTSLGASLNELKKRHLVAPSIIVVGEVARLARPLAWLKREKPLFGRRIVTTRPEDQSAEFNQNLRDKGAYVISSPAIAIEPLSDDFDILNVRGRLKANSKAYDWAVFLSANGARMFAKAFGGDLRILNQTPICAVGPQTRQTILELGGRVQKMAKAYNARGVAAVLGRVKGKRVLIPRVESGPQDLRVALLKRGAQVDEITVYRTVPVLVAPAVKKEILKGVEAVAFTSGSTVRSFCQSFTAEERRMIFRKAYAVSIGPITSAALRQFGIRNIRQPTKATTDGMIQLLCRITKS